MQKIVFSMFLWPTKMSKCCFENPGCAVPRALDEPRVVLALMEDMRHEHRVIAVEIERNVVIHWSCPVPQGSQFWNA